MSTAAAIIFLILACLPLPSLHATDLLVAGFSADKVYRFDGTTGSLVGEFASHPTLMDGPTALVYNSAGNLLVLNEFSLNVLSFDGTTGTYLSTFISSASLGSVGITDPDDMEIGADGNLYITSHFNTGGNIWKFDGTTGGFLSVFASSPPAHHSHGLAFGPGGNLFQGNVDGGLIEKFDGTTGASLGTFAIDPSLFPVADLAFSSTTLYVTLDGGGGVARINSTTGAYIDRLIPAGVGASHWGILVDSGFLYTANTATGTIKKFNATTGSFISDFITGAPGIFDMVAMPVPEPGTCLLVLAGIAFIAAIQRHRGSQ